MAADNCGYIGMPNDFYPLAPEEQLIVLVTYSALRQAQNLIAFCEHCDTENSECTFEMLLDRVTGSDPTRTEYIIEAPARCPNCRREVLEKTLVVPHSFPPLAGLTQGQCYMERQVIIGLYVVLLV